MEVIHCTPTKEELFPTREIPCTYATCNTAFTNIGHLNMHLIRHHGIKQVVQNVPNGSERVFHCPQLQCSYHENHKNRKYFKTLKYLRQHYQKMHITKTNMCDRCGKGFITAGQLFTHMENLCGVKFTCKECGWTYSSMEALLTHGRRKGHMVYDMPAKGTNMQAQCKSQTNGAQVENNNQETQTEGPALVTRIKSIETTDGKDVSTNTQPLINLLEQETQTEDVPLLQGFRKGISNCLHAISIDPESGYGKNASTNTQIPIDILEPRHIETQTDDQMVNILSHNNFTTSTSAMHTSMQSAQLLPPSIHTYTQTYEDLFPDSLLGFTDIQTQTNWSSFPDAAAGTAEEADTNQYNSPGAGTCTRCAYDELLVSTETQTSFTQCLLESRTNNADTEDAAFGNLYQTQHTQTCDMLLGALFGSQESDLIGGYQSTHTQT